MPVWVAHPSYTIATALCEATFNHPDSVHAVLPLSNIHRKQEESRLKHADFPEEAYKGLDEIHYLTQLGEYLRSHSIDPKQTHIADIVFLIHPLIQHIREGITQHHHGYKKLQALRSLRQFEKEANQRIKEQKVTLYWWQVFNIQLSLLVTPSKDRTSPLYTIEWEVYDSFAEQIENFHQYKKPYNISKTVRNDLEIMHNVFNSFPNKVILPTISPLGVLAINKVTMEGRQIIPFEIVNQKTYADGNNLSPIEYTFHDLTHIFTGYGEKIFPEHDKFHNLLISNLEGSLPAQIIYFFLGHESLSFNRLSIDQINKENLQKIIDINLIDNPTAIITECRLLTSLDPSRSYTDQEYDHFYQEFQQVFEQSIEEFMRIFEKTISECACTQ